LQFGIAKNPVNRHTGQCSVKLFSQQKLSLADYRTLHIQSEGLRFPLILPSPVNLKSRVDFFKQLYHCNLPAFFRSAAGHKTTLKSDALLPG